MAIFLSKQLIKKIAHLSLGSHFARSTRSVRSGSALLIAVLVMGILITLTLGLSDLVVREIRQTQDVVVAGKAYFAAEAGIEKALYDLHEHLPGYETKPSADKSAPADYIDVKGQGDEQDFHYRYRILNTGDKVPYFDPDKPIYLSPDSSAVTDATNGQPRSSSVVYSDFPEATYNVLPLHGSVVIPLSSDPNGDGNVNDVQDFMVQYYFNFDKGDPNMNASLAKNLDILRWKIYGHPKIGPGDFDALKTDAISDLYPASYDSSAQNPVCIGSNQDVDPNTTCSWAEWFSNGQWQPWGAARECYLSDANSTKEFSELNDIQTADNGGCTIKDFLQTHTQNYLVLENYVVPETVGITNVSLDTTKANIYYRVVARGGADQPKLVREEANISSQGFGGNDRFQQSIDASIGMSSFLPVFNFSLYRTDSSKTERGSSGVPSAGLF